MWGNWCSGFWSLCNNECFIAVDDILVVCCNLSLTNMKYLFRIKLLRINGSMDQVVSKILQGNVIVAQTVFSVHPLVANFLQSI